MGHREIDMRSEFEGSSKCQSLQDVGARLTSKHKMKQSIWGSESKFSGGKQVEEFILSGLGSLESVIFNNQAKCRELIGMTFCKKPLIAD